MKNRNHLVSLGSWRSLAGILLALIAALAIMLVATPAKSLAAEDEIKINEETFPDPKFREWLLDEKTLKGIGADGVLTKAERDGVDGLYPRTRGIKSIKGIEYFPNIITLNAEGNQISKVDLSKNPKLQVIYLRNNVLESIDFSHNLDLQFIEVFDNKLTSVDVSMLEKLKFLHIDYNRLKVLDLSHNLNLEGDGFVAANNPTLERIILPNLPNLKLDPGVFHEQDPIPGYKHTQWYSSENDQPINPKDPKFPFTGQTLYTKRIPNDYVVKYSAGSDQASGKVDDLSTVWDQDFNAPENGYTWENHEFQGWRLPNGKIVQPGQSLRNLAGKDDTGQVVTLRAVWKDLTPPKPSVPPQPNSTEGGSEGVTPPNNPDAGAGNSGAPEAGNSPETGKPGNNKGNGQPVETENGESGSNPAPGSAENGNSGAQPAQPTKPETGTQPAEGEGENTTNPQPSPAPGPAPAPGNSGDANAQPEAGGQPGAGSQPSGGSQPAEGNDNQPSPEQPNPVTPGKPEGEGSSESGMRPVEGDDNKPTPVEPKPGNTGSDSAVQPVEGDNAQPAVPPTPAQPEQPVQPVQPEQPEEPKPVKPNVAAPTSDSMGLEADNAASNHAENGQPAEGGKTEVQQPGKADKMSAKTRLAHGAAAGQLAKTGSSAGLFAGFCTLLLSLGAVLRRLRFHR